MLQRIIGIRNVGRFRNSAAQPNPQLSRHAFIFGPNGFGKTTLCAVLRSLERNEPALVIGRKTLGVEGGQAVNLLWSGAQRTFQNDVWPGPEPKLSIFDGTFVAENVHSGDLVDVANRRNLYRVVVGRNGVGLAREEAHLAEAGRALTQAVTAAERRLEPMAAGLGAQAFDQLAEDDELAVKLSAARAALAAQQQSAQILERANLQAVTLPALPPELATMMGRTLEGVDPEIEQRVSDHLARHQFGDNGERWLEQGIRHAAGDDECPFCARDELDGLPLVQAYRALFGEGYRGLRDEIESLGQTIELHFGPDAFAEVRAVAIANGAGRQFWGQHCDLGRELPALAQLRDAYLSVHHKLKGLIDRKASRPLDAVDRADDIREVAEEVELTAYNQAVGQANATIEATRVRTAAADEATLRRAIGDLERVARRHGPEGIDASRAWREAAEARSTNNAVKTAVRAQLEEHCRQVVRPYEQRINHFLHLFNAGFEIVDVDHAYPGGLATCTYRLRIDNVEVQLGDSRTSDDRQSFKNTLSAGDRTTLAMAFFLAELEREADIAERVVVFDDPFNSQDSYRRRNTIHEIMAVARRGAQVVVLSHDAVFLKSLWDKSPPAERSAAQLDYHPATGTRLTEFDLDNACRGRAQSELDDLIAYRNLGQGEPRDIIKKLRVVLETKMRDLYPVSFAPADNLGAILGKIRGVGDAHPAAARYDELDRINDYTQDYHHGEDSRGMQEPPLDQQELLGFVDQTLRIANAVVG
jgi:wobble nucleotide-excising tRNase